MGVKMADPVVRKVLANGLTVQLLPIANFHKTYAILTTNFGSVDRKYKLSPNDEWQTIPDGIAHFLEHKLFEKENYDAFDLFGEHGADANAFTGFTQTSYLFSTTSQLKENLEVLLDFVQAPYFSAASVAKEQGIIGEEIKMYADNPGNRLYMGMMENLYPHDPMHIDIAGTVESIAQITPETLYAVYQAFYQPSNMTLSVVGALDVEETFSWIKNNQAAKEFISASKPIRYPIISDPSGADVIKSRTISMAVERPKVMVGLRGLSSWSKGRDRLKAKSAIELGLEMLFDDTTDNYLQLYNRGILDDSFSFSFEIERGFHFASFATETDQVQAFIDEMKKVLENAEQLLVAGQDQFEATKRASLGRLIFNLDSPEAIANRFEGALFDQATIYDEIAVLEEITFEDVLSATLNFIKPMCLTAMVINPLHND